MSTTTEVGEDARHRALADGGGDPAVRRQGDLPLTTLDGGRGMLVANAPDAVLTLPFFVDSVADLASRNVPVRVVPITEFINRAPRAGAAAFVFHVSRCGSTFLASALEATAEFLVLREPSPLNAVLSPPRAVAPRRQLLSASLGWYAALAEERRQSLVVKLPSMATMVASELCRVFPNVPAVVLVRHPFRVVASMLREPAESREWVRGDDARDRLEPQLSRARTGDIASDSVRWSAVWAAMAEEIAPLIAAGRVRAVSYADLVTDPVGVIRDLRSAWADTGELSPDAERSVAAAAALDAKHPERVFHAGLAAPRLDPLEVLRITPIVEPALAACAAAGLPLSDV
jgi:hypothetical protein